MIQARRQSAGWLLLLLVLATTGCMRNSWKTEMQPMRVEYDERLNFFLGGLVPTIELHSDEFCQRGEVAEIRTKMTFGNALAQFFTFHIWVPRKLTVNCARVQGEARVPGEENTQPQPPLLAAGNDAKEGEL